MFSEGVGPFTKILVLSLINHQIGSIRINLVNAAYEWLLERLNASVDSGVAHTATTPTPTGGEMNG